MEDKVARLESRLENSHAGYREFYDFALSDNLANTNPALFDVLTKLTKEIKTPSDCGQTEPRSARHDDPSRSVIAESVSSSSSEGRDHHHRSNPHPTPPLSAESSVEEVIPMSQIMAPRMSTTAPTTSSAGARGMPAVWGYEVVYEPHENTPQALVPYGYPAYMNQGPPPQIFGPLQQQQQPVQMGQPLMQSNLQPMPPQTRPSSLPQELELPRTNAYQETSFSRFFHRRCLEFAFTLLSEPQRHQHMIDRVFAHALKHSSQEAIWNRLKNRLHLSVDEDLDAPIPYQSPADMDQNGRWLKPTDIQEYFKNRGMHVHPRAHTLEYVTEDDSPPAEEDMTWNPPQALQQSSAVPSGQMLVAPLSPYQNMPGMYMDQMGQQYPPHGSWTPATSAIRRKKIVLDVNRLVNKLTRASKCRGKTPAVRQQDVDYAVHHSILSVEAC